MECLRVALAVLLTALCACVEPEVLGTVSCELPCYTGPATLTGVGVCQAGHPNCVDGEFVSCVDEVLPGEEMCNGLDDDCNGVVDDGLPIPTCHSIAAESLVTGDNSNCHDGRLLCVGGREQCLGASGPIPEVCNGRDDDCDGEVDEDLPPLSVCYTGDLHDLTHANTACRAGVEVCVRGGVVCVGQTLPSEEVCDLQDNDCNGRVDDVPILGRPGPADIVFMFDESGSMSGKQEQHKMAVIAFILSHRDRDYRYAVCEVPPYGQDRPRVALGFTRSASTATTAISKMTTSHGAMEFSYDALIYSVDGAFQLSWRPRFTATRHDVWFGDEPGQSYEGLEYTELDAAGALAEFGVEFTGFIDLTPQVAETYDDIARLTGGTLNDIGAESKTLQLQLDDAVEDGCPR